MELKNASTPTMAAAKIEQEAPLPTPLGYTPVRPESPLLDTRRARITGIWLLLGLGLALTAYVLQMNHWPASGLWPLLTLIPVALAAFSGSRSRALATLSVGLGATAYLYATAVSHHRELFMKWHDEYMHMLQAQMLAHGRLWMPAHPVADFFESFHIVVKPVYAAMYFPGTALLYVPAAWAHLPGYATALLISGTGLALTYLVVAELIDSVSGALAVLMLLGLPWVRILATMVMSHPAFILLGMALVWSWLQWRREQRFRWAAAMGAFAGWAAITRPADAIVYSAPIAICMLFDLWERPWRHWVLTSAVVVATAAPFLGLQLIADRGITGKWLETPFTYVSRQEVPDGEYGAGAGGGPAGVKPQSDLPQKQDYYEFFNGPMIQQFRGQSLLANWLTIKLPATLVEVIASPALLLLLPLCTLKLSDRRRWALLATLPLFVIMYAPMPVLLPHYSVDIAPGVALAILLGAAALRGFSRAAHLASLGVIAALSIGALPEFNTNYHDGQLDTPTIRYLETNAARDITLPAVILFRYRQSPNVSFHEEPVYNVDAAWPDDEQIVRAHDLGPRNIEIFRYYARVQPERTFYLLDRSRHTLTYLGKATELARGSDIRAPGTQ